MEDKQYTTQNISAANKNKEVLKKNFAHCFDKNGDFDFAKFKKELSESDVNFSKEGYSMEWLGKSYARLLASDAATTLLKEDEVFNAKEQNKNSENLLLKGDNLEVLKHLSNAYHEQVKMIYIDPPYNTGSDGFVYQDDRKFTVQEFRHLAGVNEDSAKRILDFVDSKSNSHSAWLTFMYPRLYIAKQLLKDDGVIFVSIDDNEVAQLKLLMDEVFGEENFMSEFIWKKKQGGGNDSNSIVIEHEYIISFTKSESKSNLNLDTNYKLDDSLYPFKDEKGEYGLVTLDKSSIRFSDSLVFEIEDKKGVKYHPRVIKGKQSCWRWSKKKVEEDFKDLVFKNGKVYTRYYRPEGITPKSLLINSIYGRTETGNDDIKKMFDNNKPFSYPKPISLIKHFLMIGSKNNDLILDFFAGSGTTGDAVMQLNAEDGGNRKFILVQLAETIDKKKNKAAYDFVKEELKIDEPSIFDITKERLIRSANKIKEESKDKKGSLSDVSNLDLGFKIFETMPIWEDYNLEAEEFEAEMTLFDEVKLSEEDIKALLITWKTNDGIALTIDLVLLDLGGYKAYYFENKLYLMDKGFETKHLKTLLEYIDKKKDLNPSSIIAFGYHFDSKNLREISENVKSYTNKKNIDIDFITRY